MFITRLIFDVLLALLLLSTGGGKLRQLPSSLAIRDSLGLSNRAWKTIGALELVAVVGLLVGIWIPVAGLLASAGVVALMIGAIVVRARVGQKTAAPYIADTVVVLLALAATVLHALAA
jgi:hypothetical protein